MLANYYTLRHIALQLNQKFRGFVVSDAFSQSKNELIIGVSPVHVQHEPGLREFVITSCEPAGNCLYAAPSFSRARRNSVNLFPQIIGHALRAIEMHPSDRQITFTMDNGERLLIQFFGSKANVLLVDGEDHIIDAFLRPRETIGQQSTVRNYVEPVINATSMAEQFRELGEVSLGVAIKKFYPRFGTTLLAELLDRSGLARSESVDRLSEVEIRRIVETGSSIINELESDFSPRIYYDGSNAIEFSIIELRHCRHLQAREFSSLDEAIRIFRGSVRNRDHVSHDKSKIEQGLRKELERTARTLLKISEEIDSTDRASEYERMGELLKAHLHELRKGAAEAIVENTLDGSNELIAIPIDKNLTPAKNADRYFERAKKSRIAAGEKLHQRTRLVHAQRQLQTALEQLGTIVSGDELETYVDEHRELLYGLGLAKPAAAKNITAEEIPFRVFRVAGDFVVWAGKSGENNDLLSTRYTKGRDLWFHARSVGGSHVVLKFGTGKGEISKKAIHEAAAIAAYYSKMKNSKLVPVSVCEGKYVRKPKGVPAGTVRIEREEVIFVEPRLPAPEA